VKFYLIMFYLKGPVDLLCLTPGTSPGTLEAANYRYERTGRMAIRAYTNLETCTLYRGTIEGIRYFDPEKVLP
jgi:hypothetical protein